MKQLPSDCALLPLFSGALLVSSGHAVFCRIAPSDMEAVQRVLRQEQPFDALGDRLRRSLEQHGFLSPPQQRERLRPKIQLQFTNACNLSCAYCCTNSLAPRKDELDEAGFAQIIRDVRRCFGTDAQVSFLGGEPFLVPFAVRLARLARELELKLTIFSNGLPLADDEALLEEVADLTRNGLQLRISLAGASPETCDVLSGEPRFERVMKMLQKLSKKGGKACVDVMLTPQNAADMAAEFHRFKKRLPEGFKVSLGVLYTSGRETGEHLFPSRDQLEQALTDIAFEAGEIIEAKSPEPIMPRRDGCDCAVGLNLSVRSDGSLFPCFKMEERIGSIQELSLAEALEEIGKNPHPASALETCRNCALNTLCGGGCRSDNLLYTGTGEPLCGPWRVRVMSELLAEDCVSAVTWSVPHLYAEAKRRGIEVPESLPPVRPSRHCIDV